VDNNISSLEIAKFSNFNAQVKVRTLKFENLTIDPILGDHLSYVTLFQCFLVRSDKTGLTV
jgi:hypothetical protein